MYAYKLQPGQPYTYNDTVYRAIAAGGRPSVNVATGLEFHPGPLVEVEPYTEGTVSEHTEICERCGETAPVSMLTRRVEKYYDWDDPDEDRQGSVLLSRTVWTCRDEGECRRRRRQMAQAAIVVAESEDAAARESGWGAVGGGR